MRAAAGFHAGDAVGGQRARAHQIFGVPLGVDVVGDGGDVVAVAQFLAQQVHQRGLAGADRAADADAQRPMRIGAVGVFIGRLSLSASIRASVIARILCAPGTVRPCHASPPYPEAGAMERREAPEVCESPFRRALRSARLHAHGLVPVTRGGRLRGVRAQ